MSNDINGIDGNRLLSYIERIERIEAEKKSLEKDIRDVFQEATSANFDIKAMKEIIKLRKKDKSELDAEEFILEQYRLAIGFD